MASWDWGFCLLDSDPAAGVCQGRCTGEKNRRLHRWKWDPGRFLGRWTVCIWPEPYFKREWNFWWGQLTLVRGASPGEDGLCLVTAVARWSQKRGLIPREEGDRLCQYMGGYVSKYCQHTLPRAWGKRGTHRRDLGCVAESWHISNTCHKAFLHPRCISTQYPLRVQHFQICMLVASRVLFLWTSWVHRAQFK